MTFQSRSAASKRESHCAYTTRPRSVSTSRGIVGPTITNPVKCSSAYATHGSYCFSRVSVIDHRKGMRESRLPCTFRYAKIQSSNEKFWMPVESNVLWYNESNLCSRWTRCSVAVSADINTHQPHVHAL